MSILYFSGYRALILTKHSVFLDLLCEHVNIMDKIFYRAMLFCEEQHFSSIVVTYTNVLYLLLLVVSKENNIYFKFLQVVVNNKHINLFKHRLMLFKYYFNRLKSVDK